MHPEPDVAVKTRDVLTRLALPVYLPAFAVNGGTAMLVPIIPIYLRDEGFSVTMLSIVIAASGVGGVLTQVPFGRLIARIGETKTMAMSVVAMAVTAALFGATATAVVLVALRLAWGVGSVGWLLSRQTFLTRTVDSCVRGRAMSVFGGVTRGAVLAGPILSGVIAARISIEAAFVATGVVTIAGLVPLALWRASPTTEAEPTNQSRQPLDLRRYRRILALAGGGQICVMAARQGRFVVLPLLGRDAGLDVEQIGLLVGVGSFADLVLFPVAGYTMDRFGRLAAIVPAFGLLAAGLFLLSARPTTGGIIAAAVVMGIGNGIGSGSMLTVSSDLAPRHAPSEFLGALGTIRDSGKVAGPIIVGILADNASLSTSSFVLGVIALGAVGLFVFGVGETRDWSGDQQPMRPSPTAA